LNRRPKGLHLLASMMAAAGPSFAAYTVSCLLAGGTSLIGALVVLAEAAASAQRTAE
jgi:hypothetical protein